MPPHNQNQPAQAGPRDDPEVADEDGLLRYINPDYHVVPDKNTGEMRLSSAAFAESSKPPKGMSVDLERQMSEAGLSNLEMLPGPDFGALRLNAGEVRVLGCQVSRDPVENNPYHGSVWGIGKSRKRRIAIAGLAEWIKKPASMP